MSIRSLRKVPAMLPEGAADALGDSGRGLDARVLAEGPLWRVQEVLCRAGPGDPRFEERHAWASFAAVLGGTFTYRTQRGRALLVPGGWMLGEPEQCFECGHDHAAGDRCVSFHLAPALAEEVQASVGRARDRAPAGLPPVAALLPALVEARALAGATPDPLRCEQACLDVAAAVYSVTGAHAALDASDADRRRAAQAVGYIDSRLAAPLTIADMARAVGLSTRCFAHAFRRAVGLSPYAFVLQRRLEAAARRLREDTAPVLEVALAVGFGDLSEFTRRFRAHFGAPPGRFRGATRGTIAPPTNPESLDARPRHRR